MLTTLVTVLIFLVMISLHEFGHFITGKLLRFNILEYAIGFGPTLFKKERNGTLYSFRAIPFGGFCRFSGEDDHDSDDEGDFNRQPCYKRIIVLVAGAFFNIVLGFIIFCIIVASGKSYFTNTINTVLPETYLADTGIMPGDKITKVNGSTIGMYQDIQLCTSGLQSDDTIQMTVLRGDKEINAEFKPSVQHVKISYNEDGAVYEETINGKYKKNEIPYGDSLEKNESLIGKSEEYDRFLIGFSPKAEEINAFNILPQSFRMTKFVVKLLYRTLFDLVSGRGSMDQVSGPVGVVKEVDTAVHSGSQSLLYVLNIIALLTINLGVFNLLPIPALDGGRLLFVIIEWIRRKPVEREALVHAVGFAILMAFMLFVSYRDIIKLFKT